ncbi:MAG: prepilin-type N-terminal cleavage/methylation domain-containing protein [Alteromonadaceae bacterium]|nr:prepilin-type N-terminal cleavage/methylation domain-containing protein [Alteromonadaceae bacterium]
MNGGYISRGFSLVEVLIAVSILMTVLFIGNLAYRTYSVYWNKELGSFDSSVKMVRQLSNLHAVIRNIKPIVLKGGDAGGFVYFEGGDSLIRAVGNTSVGNEQFAVAFEIEVQTQDDDSSVLLYREYPISSPLVDEGDIGSYGAPTVLLENLQDIRFEYLGWPSYKEFAAFESSENYSSSANTKWFGLYSGKDTLVSPLAVKLSLKRDEKWSEIRIPLTHFSHKDLLQFVGADD